MSTKSFARIFSRYFISIAVTVMIIGIVSGLAVYSLDTTWTSSAKFAIERSEGHLEEAKANSQELLYQRIDHLKNSILSRENILSIAEQEGFVESTPVTIQEINDTYSDVLERAIINIENASVVNQYTGKLGLLPTAITVSFDGRTADEALKIANVLSSQILRFDRERTASSGEIRTKYLEGEASRSSRELVKIERRIADFKMQNALLLPELYESTVRRLDEVNGALARSLEAMTALQQSYDQTGAEIATTNTEALLFAPDGTRIEATDERIDRLRLELAAAEARYTGKHPEVIRLQRDLQALNAASGRTDTRATEVELTLAQERLVKAKERYSVDHPEILRLGNLISSLERNLKQARTEFSAEPQSTSVPSSPAYNRLLAKRDSVVAGIERELARANEYRLELAELEERLQLMPTVELQWLELQREADSEREALAEKQTVFIAAQLDAGLREAELLGTLQLVNGPTLALVPSSPKKSLLYTVAGFLSLMLAVSFALVRALAGDVLWELRPKDIPHGAVVHSIPTFK